MIIELKHFFIQHTGSRICYWSLEKGVLAILGLNTECIRNARIFIFQPVGNFSYITVSHKHESYDEIGTAIIGKSAS